MLLFKLVFENQKTSMQLNMCRVAALDMANTNQNTRFVYVRMLQQLYSS